jgi:hypothetical protein
VVVVVDCGSCSTGGSGGSGGGNGGGGMGSGYCVLLCVTVVYTGVC